MKVHPSPKKKKRSITVRYDIISALSEANAVSIRQKKLRRLPHIFEKVLELPFHSDADVSIEETPNYFRFVVETTDDMTTVDIRAQTIEIYPGVTKIVIRRSGENVVDLSMGELELDIWRFRLPESTRPELAIAALNDGELVVTVPKEQVVDVWEEEEEEEGGQEEGRIVLNVH